MTAQEWELCGVPVVERAKREVLADIAAGHVPATVRTYSELHDHVDANYYGGAFEGELSEDDAERDEQMGFWGRVQDAVDEWIKAGRPV